jgi:Family of unknown function (DUF6318)
MVRRQSGPLRHVAAVACAVVLAVSVGCGSSPTPEPLQDSSGGRESTQVDDSDSADRAEEPEPASTPSPAPEVQEKSDTGVRATIEHYWALFNHGRVTGDYEPLRAASSPECANCQAYLRSKGRAVEGVRWEVDGEILVETEDDPDFGAAQVPMRVTPGRWQPKPGAEPTKTKADNWIFRMELRWKGAGWQVARIQLIES